MCFNRFKYRSFLIAAVQEWLKSHRGLIFKTATVTYLSWSADNRNFGHKKIALIYREYLTPKSKFIPSNVLVKSIFTARCYASAVLAMGLCPSVSVSVSVTSRCSTKTAKRRIAQITPHDSPGSLVVGCQRSPRNSTGVTPYQGAECR